jgi:hypothetical protein
MKDRPFPPVRLPPVRRAPLLAARVSLLVVLTASCAQTFEETPGIALYPNPEVRRPPDAVARLFGPIGSVDGGEVQGDAFDLSPGCHVVQLHIQMNRTNGYVAWSGRVPATVFAIRMRPGHRYIIRREIVENMGGQSGRIVLFASDEDSKGTSAPLVPARGAEDIEACRQWENNPE